jgi:hypothetical protein
VIGHSQPIQPDGAGAGDQIGRIGGGVGGEAGVGVQINAPLMIANCLRPAQRDCGLRIADWIIST